MLFEVMGDLKQAGYQRRGWDMLLQIKCDKLRQKISTNAYLLKNQVFKNKTHIFRKNGEKPGFWKKKLQNVRF